MPNIIASLRGEYARYKRTAEGTFAQLSDAELCAQGDVTGLSIAQIVWHVSGNLQSRFSNFLTEDGEKPWRRREEEFAARTVTREELLAKWEAGWRTLLDTVDALTDADLDRTVTIRQQPLLVIEALHRSVAHVAYHVGQIVYVGKTRRGADWQYLSIPPGGTAAYNQNPTREKGPPAPDSR